MSPKSLAVSFFLLAFLFPGTLALAENRFSLPTIVAAEGSTALELLVRCAHDVDVYAFSVSIRYRPSDLRVTEIAPALPEDEMPEFWDGSHDPVKGEIAYGAILSMSDPSRFWRASPDRALVRLKVDVLAKATVYSPVEFIDGLGEFYPIDNVLTIVVNNNTRSLKPARTNGSIVVAAAPAEWPAGAALAEAGPDRLAPELSTAVLDGSGTSWPQRPSRIFWTQVSGPAAQPSGAQAIFSPRYLLPAVAGDTQLVFELSVGDAAGTLTDRTTITAADMDLRKGSLSVPAGSTASWIERGRRALVFTGRLRWDGVAEDASWTSIRFHARGAGDESKLLSATRLYVDENGNGALDSADRQVGTDAAIASDGGAVSFGLLESLATGQSRDFFLVVDVAPASVAAGNILLQVLLLALALEMLRRGARRDSRAREILRPARILAAGLLLCMALFPIACGGGGGGNGVPANPPPSREVRFDLLGPEDIGLQGVTTGIRISPGGLPIQGPALNV